MIELAESVCVYCERTIVADLDERSTLDWGDDGDYGCGANPLSGDDGTWGHQPANRYAVTLTDAVRGLFNQRLRGTKYIDQSRAYARTLGLER